MKVSTLLSVIEYFIRLLYKAAERHTTRATDLDERINALKYERSSNQEEAKRARAVADKMAELIS